MISVYEQRRARSGVLVLSVLIPASALANAGTPLMWMGVNMASYCVLVAWCRLHTSVSLVTELSVVPAEDFPLPANLALYTIAPDGTSVNRAIAGKTERIADISESKGGKALTVRPAGNDGFDLFLSRDDRDRGAKGRIIKNRFALRAPVESRPYFRIYSEEPILSFVSSSDWEFVTAFWPNVGIKGENKKTGERFHYALETPFLAWSIRDATHLPGDLVIFRLGRNQICLLDPKQKKLSLLARGFSPVVAEVVETSDER